MSAPVASRERRRRDRQGYLGCGGTGGVVGGANRGVGLGCVQLYACNRRGRVSVLARHERSHQTPRPPGGSSVGEDNR